MTDTLLIGPDKLAELLDISKRTLWRWCSGGKVPRPIIDGHTKRWSLNEIGMWIAAGCPCRKMWEIQKKSGKG